MSQPCRCNIEKGPSIREIRRDSFKEAVALLREANLPKPDDGGVPWGFEEAMTLACHLIGLGEEDDD